MSCANLYQLDLGYLVGITRDRIGAQEDRGSSKEEGPIERDLFLLDTFIGQRLKVTTMTDSNRHV